MWNCANVWFYRFRRFTVCLVTHCLLFVEFPRFFRNSSKKLRAQLFSFPFARWSIIYCRQDAPTYSFERGISGPIRQVDKYEIPLGV